MSNVFLASLVGFEMATERLIGLVFNHWLLVITGGGHDDARG